MVKIPIPNLNYSHQITTQKRKKKIRLIAKHNKRGNKCINQINQKKSQFQKAPPNFIESSQSLAKEINCFYQIENKTVLTKYSREIMQLYNNFQEVKVLLPYVSRNKSISLFDRENLLKTVDSCIASYQGEEETFFLTSAIIDKYVNKISISNITKSSFHLIGLTAFFIASKMEDIVPLCLSQIQSIIGKNQFSADDIVDKEIDILTALDFDLDYISVYDIIKTYFCDFIVKCKEENMTNDINEIFSSVFFSSVLFAKICESDEFLKSTPITIKAISCIILGYDYEKSKDVLRFQSKGNIFFQSWFDMLIKQSGVYKESIQYVYNYLKALFHNMTGYHERRRNKKRLTYNKSK